MPAASDSEDYFPGAEIPQEGNNQTNFYKPNSGQQQILQR